MNFWQRISLTWTRHGRTRADERGIPSMAVRAALFWGFRTPLPDGDGYRIRLDAAAIREAAAAGCRLAPWLGLELITNRDESIRTLYWGGAR